MNAAHDDIDGTGFLSDDDFAELAESIRQAGAIRRGETAPSRSFRYEGGALVEVAEDGVVTWRLADAAVPALADAEEPDVLAIRTALRQTQAGFAALLGVPVGTLRGWEQRRRAPQGPARRLLRLAARRPDVLAGL